MSNLFGRIFDRGAYEGGEYDEFDPLNFCKKISPRSLAKGMGFVQYKAEPAVMYPATIARIQHALESRRLPGELLGSSDPAGSFEQAAIRLRTRASRIPPEVWASCMVPTIDLISKGTEPEFMLRRNEALETAFRWFLRAFKMRLKGGCALYLPKDTRYDRYKPPAQ